MKKILALMLVNLGCLSTYAVVSLPHVFGDHMVLQQGAPIPVWGSATPGEKVSVKLNNQTVTTTADVDGKWLVKFPAMKATSEPLTLTVAGENTVTFHDVLIGEVWVASGQSNMSYTLYRAIGPKISNINDPGLRFFTVELTANQQPQANVAGDWTVCTPTAAKRYSAVAYYFARDLRQKLKVPVGVIHSSWGGTPAEAWTPRQALEANPELKPLVTAYDEAAKNYNPAKAEAEYKIALAAHPAAVAKAKADGEEPPREPEKPVHPANYQKSPAALYNAMIAPLQPFAIKGAIWYQGENNYKRSKEYRTLFPVMIQSWRQTWGQGDFPFLFVQLAPFKKLIPEIREAQFLTWQRVANTAMAVITDCGDPNTIHPARKEPVGERLALAAQALAYGDKIEYSGPVYQSMKIDGGQAVLSFSHIDSGLVAKGGALKGFTIAGADKQFVPAQATIRGNEIVVESAQVTKPVAVRFGWANVPQVNLYNSAGLPATPFRTDVE